MKHFLQDKNSIITHEIIGPLHRFWCFIIPRRRGGLGGLVATALAAVRRFTGAFHATATRVLFTVSRFLDSLSLVFLAAGVGRSTGGRGGGVAIAVRAGTGTAAAIVRLQARRAAQVHPVRKISDFRPFTAQCPVPLLREFRPAADCFMPDHREIRDTEKKQEK